MINKSNRGRGMGDLIFIKDYMSDEKSRHALNVLMQNCLGYEIETWYQNKSEETYIPYSFRDNTEIVANVSVYIQNIDAEGEKLAIICLDHIVAHPKYYHKQLIEELIHKIVDDYKSEVIYLNVEDSVMPFYSKFGFVIEEEVARYIDIKEPLSGGGIEKAESLKVVEDIASYQSTNVYIGKGTYITNHTGKRVQDILSKYKKDVYYIPQSDTYVVAKLRHKTLEIIYILSQNEPTLKEVIEAFAEWSFNEVKLSRYIERIDDYEIREEIGDNVCFTRPAIAQLGMKYLFPIYIEA